METIPGCKTPDMDEDLDDYYERRDEDDERRRLGYWCHRWFVAAYWQAHRALDRWENVAATESPEDTEIELLLFVDALNNVRRSAAAVLGETASAVSDFDSKVPGLVALRNQIEHHDEYLQGKGRLQKKAKACYWDLGIEGGSIQLDSGEPRSHLRLRIDSWDFTWDASLPDSLFFQYEEIEGSGEIDVVSAVAAALELVIAVREATKLSEEPYAAQVGKWIERHWAQPRPARTHFAFE